MSAPSLGLVIIASPRLAGRTATCLDCARQFQRGPATVALACERETVGFLCEPCLPPEVRAQVREAEREVAR
jgi:hypothetical protein